MADDQPARQQEPRHHRMARRPSRQARSRRRRRLVLSADAEARRQGGISRRPYSGRGVLRHRRHRRPFHRPAAHAAGAGPVRRTRSARSASPTTDTIVVYDGTGLYSAPRVWWTFRIFGAKNVYILDGGLPAWKAEGRPLEAGEVKRPPRKFKAELDTGAVAMVADVQLALNDGSAQVVDARPAGRFRGSEPEPRPGMRAGHMPGAFNVPFADIDRERPPRLARKNRAGLRRGGVDLDKPMITTCGSGVTAAMLALGSTPSASRCRALRRLLDRMGRPARFAGHHQGLTMARPATPGRHCHRALRAASAAPSRSTCSMLAGASPRSTCRRRGWCSRSAAGRDRRQPSKATSADESVVREAVTDRDRAVRPARRRHLQCRLDHAHAGGHLLRPALSLDDWQPGARHQFDRHLPCWRARRSGPCAPPRARSSPSPRPGR